MVLRSNFLPTAFGLIFDKVDTIIAGIPETNLPMVKLASHLGFEPLGEIPDAVDKGISRVIMTMPRESCAWLMKEAA
jgi:hypothetical protein